MTAVGYGTHMKFNEMTFVDDEGYPGGPLAFDKSSSNNVVDMTGTAA